MMRRRAAHAPMNLSHKVSLVEASLARGSGDVEEALALCEGAGRAATQQGYTHEAALADHPGGSWIERYVHCHRRLQKA